MDSCAEVAQRARLAADDLDPENERRTGLRSLAGALKTTLSVTSLQPPDVAVRLAEIAPAELLIEQIRLRSRLPARLVRHCRDCGLPHRNVRPGRDIEGARMTFSLASRVLPTKDLR